MPVGMNFMESCIGEVPEKKPTYAYVGFRSPIVSEHRKVLLYFLPNCC